MRMKAKKKQNKNERDNSSMPQTEVQELLDFFDNNGASSSAEDECTDPDSALLDSLGLEG